MILVRAPFRISLGGGGTDLPSYYSRFGGFIVSAAINKYLYICVNRACADNYIRVKYSRYEQVETPQEIQHDLVRPALELLQLHNNIEIASIADVPDGTGLGSSGTYLVALLTSLYELKRERIPRQALAEQACHIEMDIAGHPVGKHDHYLAAFGGITCLDIAKDGHVRVTPLDISISTSEEFRNTILLFYTGITRRSADILESQKQGTKTGDSKTVDSLHRTLELGYSIRQALEKGDLECFGRMLHEHWENKKLRSEKIADARIDNWYELARKNGVLGGKIMGAGGGGFFMFYCPPEKKAKVREALHQSGLREMSYEFDFDGAKIIANF